MAFAKASMRFCPACMHMSAQASLHLDNFLHDFGQKEAMGLVLCLCKADNRPQVL